MKKLKKLVNQKTFQIIILILITFAAYSNILHNDFAWDDREFIFGWPTIQSREDLPSILSLPSLLAGDLPEGHQGVYRPIRSVFYLFSYLLWGQNPFGYHLQAVLTQIAVTLIIYLIVLQITKKKILGFLTALLFSTHPIHTEAISYVSASFDSIGIIFFFLSFLFYLKLDNNKNKYFATYLGSILYAGLSFFTYEMNLVLPFLIIAYDFCLRKTTLNNFRERFKIYKPYFSLLLLYVVIRFIVLQIGNRADYLGQAFLSSAILSRIQFPQIILSYLQGLVLPYNLTISYPLSSNLIDLVLLPILKADSSQRLLNLFLNATPLIPLFIIILLIFITLKFLGRNLVSFCVIWILLAILPISNIIPQGAAAAERYLYIPSFGLSLLTAYLCYLIFKYFQNTKWKQISSIIIPILFIFVISFYSVSTFQRNKEWKDSLSIWLAALKVDPKSAMIHGAIGNYFYEHEQPEIALEWSLKSVALDPNTPKYRYSLALAYKKKGEIEKAITELEKINAKNPSYEFAYPTLGDLYAQKNKADLAVVKYIKAIQLNPKKYSYHYNLGALYEKQGKTNLAFSEYIKTIELNPNYSKAYNNLGVIWDKQGQTDLAIKAFNESLTLNDKNPNAYFNLAQVYEKKNNLDLAIKFYKKGLQLKPDNEIKEHLDKLLLKPY